MDALTKINKWVESVRFILTFVFGTLVTLGLGIATVSLARHSVQITAQQNRRDLRFQMQAEANAVSNTYMKLIVALARLLQEGTGSLISIESKASRNPNIAKDLFRETPIELQGKVDALIVPWLTSTEHCTMSN